MRCAPSPLSSGAFLTTATVTSFPAPRLLGRGCLCCFLPPACLCSVLWEIAPPPLGCSECPTLFAMCLFFSLYSLGGGQSVQGAMLIWPGVVCGSTACRLAHLVVCFSHESRGWCLAAREPSWFFHLTWSGDVCMGWGCGGIGVLPLLDGFSCKVYLQRLSKILL
jgi:hypothetical protein